MRPATFERSRFKDLITHDAFEMLDQRVVASQTSPYPLTANAWFAGSKGANLLTKMIVWYLRSESHYAYRNSSQGTPRRMRDGSTKWTPSSKFAKGQGDIFAAIQGRSCFFEVKVGKDKVSASQKAFKEGIEGSGGAYAICHNFDEFITEYQSILNNN